MRIQEILGFAYPVKSLNFLMNILQVKVEIQWVQYQLIAGLGTAQWMRHVLRYHQFNSLAKLTIKLGGVSCLKLILNFNHFEDST